MNVPTTLNNLQISKQDTIWNRFRNVYFIVQRVINGNIEFGNPQSGPGNIKGQWVLVTTPGTAHTDFTITHNLGYPASGYMVASSNAPGTVYVSSTPNPSPNTQSILQSDTVNAQMSLFVF